MAARPLSTRRATLSLSVALGVAVLALTVTPLAQAAPAPAGSNTASASAANASTKRWYTDLWFHPRLRERRPPRCVAGPQFSTTHNWYTYGASADDMAVVVKRHSAGVPLVNRVRGQGIAFNQSVGMMRTALGYPETDYRWSGWTSSGEDLYYCQGRDTYYSSGSFAGQMVLGCSMTGGASGGPWLSNVPSTWIGTVMSVNSNKGSVGSQGAPWMFDPYTGSQEAAVFQAYRAFRPSAGFTHHSLRG